MLFFIKNKTNLNTVTYKILGFGEASTPTNSGIQTKSFTQIK